MPEPNHPNNFITLYKSFTSPIFHSKFCTSQTAIKNRHQTIQSDAGFYSSARLVPMPKENSSIGFAKLLLRHFQNMAKRGCLKVNRGAGVGF
jgi:hypothetical protein